MITQFIRSGKTSPCPVCDRTSDGDCSIKHNGDVVFCHTHRTDDPFVVEAKGYKFSKETDAGAGWGIWYKPNPQKIGRPSVEPQVLHNYPARDGSQLIRVVRQKGGKVEFYQQYFIDGEWISPSEADRRGNRAHLESMKKMVPIYRYQEVREAIVNGQPVVWVEGESVADSLWELGQPATTSIGGSKAFTRWGDYSKDLEGLGHLLIAPDMDKPGYEYAKKVRNFYQGGKVTCIKWLHAFPDFPQWKDLPESGGLDLKDEIQEGLEIDELLTRVGAAIANGIGYPMDEKPVDRSAYQKKEASYADFLAEVKQIALIKDYGERYFKLCQLSRRTGFALNYLEKQLKHCISEVRGLLKSKIIDFMEESVQATEPIIPNFLYRDNVTMIVSQPGTGKSLLAYDFVYQLITGGEFMDFPLTPKKVLLIQLDEAEQDCKKRVLDRMEEIYTLPIPAAQKTELKRKALKNLRAVSSLNFRGMAELTDHLDDWRPDVVVVDNFREACNRAGVKENEQEAGEFLGDIKEACREYNSALLMIHHEVKSTFAEGQNRSSGHGSIMGQCAVAFTFEKPKKGSSDDRRTRTLNCIKNRLGEDVRSHQFKLNYAECSWSMGYLGEVDFGWGSRDKTVSDDLAARILKMTCEAMEGREAEELYFSVLDIKRYCQIPDSSHYPYAQLEFAQQRGLLKVRHERAEEGGKLRKYYAANFDSLYRNREKLRIDELLYSKGFNAIAEYAGCDELNFYLSAKREKGSNDGRSKNLDFEKPVSKKMEGNSVTENKDESLEPLENNQFTNSPTSLSIPDKDAKPRISIDRSQVDPKLEEIEHNGRVYVKGCIVRLVGRKGNDQAIGLGFTQEGQPFALLAMEAKKHLLEDLQLISVPFRG